MGLTQEQVASKSFIDRSYYSQIESGKRNPGPKVAENIARVLGINPMDFFRNDPTLSFSSDDDYVQSLNWNIFDYLETADCRQILYLYSGIENYLKNISILISMSIKKRRLSVILDNNTNFNKINKMLKKDINKDERLKYIYHINSDQCHKKINEDILRVSQILFDDVSTLCIFNKIDQKFEYDYSKLSKSFSPFDIKSIKEKNIFIFAYNSIFLSAEENIKMMKIIPLLMTDEEIVSSPFNNLQQKGIPTLYIKKK